MTGFFSRIIHHWQPSQKACVKTHPIFPVFPIKKTILNRLLVHWLIPDVTDLLIGPHLQRQRGSLRLDIFATCTYNSAKQNYHHGWARFQARTPDLRSLLGQYVKKKKIYPGIGRRAGDHGSWIITRGHPKI